MDFQTAIPVTLMFEKIPHSFKEKASSHKSGYFVQLVSINSVVRVLPRTSRGITDLLLP